jgi:hypothetical protein
LILVRHPVAFVASILRLGWDEELDLIHLSQQPELVEDYFSDESQFLHSKRNDVIEKAAAMWRALNKVLLLQANHHSNWIVITHEALSQSPLETFQRLYQIYDLPWSMSVKNMILKTTNSKNTVEASTGRVQQFSRNSSEIFKLRRKMLSLEQRKKIFEITSDVALKIYPSESFDIDAS